MLKKFFLVNLIVLSAMLSLSNGLSLYDKKMSNNNAELVFNYNNDKGQDLKNNLGLVVFCKYQKQNNMVAPVEVAFFDNGSEAVKQKIMRVARKFDYDTILYIG